MRACSLIAAALVALAPQVLPPRAASAQPADMGPIPQEMLGERRTLAGNRVRICLNGESVLMEHDRAVGRAIAESLLLEPAFHEIRTPFNPRPYDFRIRLAPRDLFRELHNECDALMGVRFVPRGLPDWLTISRPYLHTRMVLAVPGAEATLDALAPGALIATRMAAPGDTALTQYLRNQDAETRASRRPYPHAGFVLDKLMAGEVDAAMIWEPALHMRLGGDPVASGVAVGPAPVAVREVDFAVAFMAQDTFLRGMFDDAIAALGEDGTLAALAVESGIPERPRD
jgi:polar amino acid transport system substrate-binding protein